MPRRRIVTAGMVVAMGALAACGGSSTAGGSSPARSSGAARGSGAGLTVALTHVPHGQATLTYDGTSRSMTVTIHLVGLAPSSTHPAHIHAGSCGKEGPVVYPLDPVVADAGGVATSTTRVPNVTQGGIPNGAWYINVHNGPGLKPATQALPIACGNVSTGATGTATGATVPLTEAVGSPDQAASGTARLGIVKGALQVVLNISGLAPNSSHAAHIHLGSCEAQGPVFKPLNSVVADGTGHATVTTVISTVTAIPVRGWYVNVHRTVDVSAGQTDFDPILCGDVGGATGS